MQKSSNRQVVLDTETTGMNQGSGHHYDGHKIIEIGAVEIVNRRLTGKHFHTYINPERTVDPEAFAIHGISDEFLDDKPLFKSIAHDFISFIQGAELIIHNAPFDVGFIDYEYRLCDLDFRVEEHCLVTDSLQLARKLYPGKRNNLDALCDRLQIDNSHRTLHGALLDAEILADVYLLMTGGQVALSFLEGEKNTAEKERNLQQGNIKIKTKHKLNVIYANHQELQAHDEILQVITDKSSQCLWHKSSK